MTTELDATLVNRLDQFRPRLFVGSLVSGLFLLLFFGAWGYQIKNDIGVAGINRPVFWGFYITNFVFWIGISHAGTLISAILRVTGAEWRRPITRCAEAVTAFALAIGGLFPIIHLGRPDRMLYMLPLPNDRGLWPNFRSPLIWDMAAITAYVLGSVLYLYLPMIPDMALLRDRSRGFKRTLYGLLALGWSGRPAQWHTLEAGIKAMALVIIPLAVSVHTIVSWDFAMTNAPMWNSTIFGPYFVVGAIYSGIAVLLIAMALLRGGLKLGPWLTDKVFNNLCLLFMAMAMFWGYFTFAEHLTVWYGNEISEARVHDARSHGPWSTPFYLMVIVNFVIPMAVLPFRWGRKPIPAAIVGFGVVIGMWLERFLIVVPTLSMPRLGYTLGTYAPSPTELAVMAGSIGSFIFLYLAFTQAVPVISIWEIREAEPLADAPGAQPDNRAAADDWEWASFDDEGALVAARQALVDAGADPTTFDIRLPAPPRSPELHPHWRSRVPLATIFGGAFGGLVIYLLAVGTSRAWPLITGHMTINPVMPIGVVTYEGIALGAVLSTVAATLLGAGLFRRHSKAPLDGEVAAGRVILGVPPQAGADADTIRRLLQPISGKPPAG